MFQTRLSDKYFNALYFRVLRIRENYCKSCIKPPPPPSLLEQVVSGSPLICGKNKARGSEIFFSHVWAQIWVFRLFHQCFLGSWILTLYMPVVLFFSSQPRSCTVNLCYCLNIEYFVDVHSQCLRIEIKKTFSF